MAKDISRVSVREKLSPRRESHWRTLEKGRAVGFRRILMATEGTWTARYFDGAKYKQEPLGDFAALPDNQRFDEAKRQAQEWFKHLNLGGSTTRETVQEACAAYAAYDTQQPSTSATMRARPRGDLNSSPAGRSRSRRLDDVLEQRTRRMCRSCLAG